MDKNYKIIKWHWNWRIRISSIQKSYFDKQYIYIYINGIVASNKFPFGKQDFEYFIGYKDNKEIRPLYIFFREMRLYKRYFDETKWMYFMIKDENVLDKYMTIWEKVSDTI